MKSKTWEWIDKSGWGQGPWLEEVDKIQWEDEATGLPCIIRRNGHAGNLCGYVGVPEGHPWFKRGYDNLLDAEVHGGLTYSEECDEDEEQGICHVEEDGIKRWWLGFDCGHSQDLAPGMRVLNFPGFPCTYKTVEYVKQECADLARQVKAAEEES